MINHREQVSIPASIAQKIFTLAQSSPDKEICGLLSAVNGKPTSVIPINNIAETPSHKYTMDPRALISAFKQLRESNASLFAIYHSHPTSTAFPSTIDIEEAAYHDAIYLIVSLNTKGVLELRGFHIKENPQEPAEELDLLIE